MLELSDVIVSAHGIYADAILAGEKTVELRREFPGIALGARLWIYETLPKGAIVGYVTVSNIKKGSPTSIWQHHKARVCLDSTTFFHYFRDTSEAVAIELSAACRVSPITIDQLWSVRKRFHPPQVAMRLTNLEAEVLRGIADTTVGLRTVSGEPQPTEMSLPLTVSLIRT